MQGYGFSVWLLPPEHIDREIRAELKEYGIEPSHRLHFTLATNVETRREAHLLKKTFGEDIHFRVAGNAYLSGKTYIFDPLYAWAVPVTLDLPTRVLDPHLSIEYMTEECSPPELVLQEHEGVGSIVVADTRSENSREWTLITKNTTPRK